MTVLLILKYKGNDTEFYKVIQKLYEGAFFNHGKLDDVIHFDLRTEMGIAHEISKQFVPVIANEVLIRAFYLIRRLYLEIKEKNIKSLDGVKDIDFKRILPYNNRTIIRMATVSSGTFMAVVSANALIKAAIKHPGGKAGFVKELLLNINYPGIGRFVFAIKADSKYISEDLLNACREYIEKHRLKSQDKVFDELEEIDINTLKKIKKTRSKYKGALTNSSGKVAISAGITVAATALTGGLALAFAPEIAILIAGESVAGLSGAALTSASLAFVGGGALSVGGLGMAGGTAIITGGGALFGTATSGAVSALSFTGKKEIVEQCASVLAYCKCILIEEENNTDAVRSIKAQIEKRIDELNGECSKEFEALTKKEIKKQIKNNKLCLKYLKKSIAELDKLLN